jgi:aldose 1-epimerase
MNRSPLSRHFGTLPTGEPVEAWTLTGASGLTVEVLTYGGIVTRLLYPFENGDWLDLVLGFRDLEPYLGRHPYFGAIVGRVAGRIPGACLIVEGEIFHLPANEAPHHLHGGEHGFDKKLWTATPTVTDEGSPSLQLTCTSPHGEQGYPGNVRVTVTYTITPDNAFVIDTHACTDRPTPLSLTHHSYFNLAGESSGSIANHSLQIDSDSFIEVNDDLAPSDRLRSVAGLPDDLRQSTPLAEALPRLTRDHGALYVVPRPAVAGEPVKIATLNHPASGRTLTCSTTQPLLQLYTASHFDGSITGKSGRPYQKYAGVCLECEGYPNGVNRPDLGDILLRPGTPQRHTTVYAFSSQPGKGQPLAVEQKGIV